MKFFFKVMKNSNIFFLFAFMFVSCFLIGCEDEKKANIIQDTSDIQEISATLYNEKEIKVTNIEKIKDLVVIINSATLTKKQSTQDIPNVDKYGKIKLMTKEDNETLYYYEKKGKYYIEEPYIGIYQCKQNLNDYFESIVE